MFHVGDVVRKLRLARGWSGEELARRAKVAVMTVSAIEGGKRNYTRKKLDAIARALDAPNASALEAHLHLWAVALVGPSPPPLRPDEREWLALGNALSPYGDACQTLAAFVRSVAQQLGQTRLQDSGRGSPNRTSIGDPASSRTSRSAASRRVRDKTA